MQKSTRKKDNGLGALSEFGWLSQQTEGFQDRMAQIGRWMSLTKGQFVYGVGDAPDAVFGLEEGLLDVAIPIHPDEMVTLHRATRGFWIGESALLAETTRGVALIAAADCRVLRLPGDAVRRHLAENPQDWTCFFRLSHMNVMTTIAALAEIVALPPRARPTCTGSAPL